MSEMLTYANELTSMTQGRGSFSMEFGHYDYVRATDCGEDVDAARRERAGEEVGRRVSLLFCSIWRALAGTSGRRCAKLTLADLFAGLPVIRVSVAV